MANETNQLQTPDKDEAPEGTVQDTTNFEEQGDQRQDQQRQQPQKKEEKEEPGEKTYYVDPNRAKILADASARKKETATEFTGSDSDPKVRYGTDVDEADLGPLEQEALARQREVRAQQGQDQQDQQQDNGDQSQQQQQQRPLNGIDPDLLARQVKIVVNGQEQIITVEEAIRRNQKIAAADDYFNQSKELLRETKDLRHDMERRANQRDDSDDGEQQDDQQYDDRGEKRQTADQSLVSLEDAEKLQMGTTEEVAETWNRLLKAAAPAVPQVDVAREVRNALDAQRTENEVKDYAKLNPEIQDPNFQKVMVEYSRQAIVEDLLATGITLEQLNATVKTPAQLTELHREARRRGIQGIRSPAAIVQFGHEKTVEWKTGKPFVRQQQKQNGADTALDLQAREQRKQQLQPQPQQRRQAPANVAQQNKTQDQGRSSRFEAIRKARGQPV